MGIVSAGIGCAVRYDRQWSWLSWPGPDGIMVARASCGPERPRALAEQPGLPFRLAEQPATADRIAALTTPGQWRLHPPVATPVRVYHPEPDRGVLVTSGSPALVAAYAPATPDDLTLASIRSGKRPEVLVLNASRPGQDTELAFVLDGHAVLAAYRELGMNPVVRILDCVSGGGGRRICWHPNGRPRRTYTEDSAEYRTMIAIASRLIEQNEGLQAYTPEQLAPEPDGHDLSCCATEWSECMVEDPVSFDTTDLDDALRAQPHTSRRARPFYASLHDPEASRPGHLVDVVDGTGVVRVFGSQDCPEASVLWFRGKPAYAEALVARGTYLHLIARLAPEQRPTGFDDLTAWLADPVIERDHSGRPMVTRELLDRITPLLKLFEPGQYEIRLEENVSPLELGIIVEGHPGPWPWPPGTGDLQFGAGGDFVPTDTWPPPDRERIEWYRTRIAAGAQPVAVLVAPGPARPRRVASKRYLLDGHHKVAAGTRTYLEITPCQDNPLDNEEFAAILEPYLTAPPFWEDSPTRPRGAPDLLCSLGEYSGCTGKLSEAEYYARFDIE
ncbi:hypothetical protein [Nocardia paucivorans]|uniref:hypothetical protein n=1 Tax=Nocardia paucivorans TaxID=114259 RepID=UPI0002EDE5AE|nr:hypothetical protein [Nocardia paucivorans]